MKHIMLLLAILFCASNTIHAYTRDGDTKLEKFYVDGSYDIRCYPSSNIGYKSNKGPARPGDFIYVNIGESYQTVLVCEVYADGGIRVEDSDKDEEIE